MPAFPTREWMDDFCAEVRRHPRAREMAAALDGVYRFVVEPAGAVRTTSAYDVEIRPDGDAGASARVLDSAGDVRLTLAADAARWQQLITGQLDLGLAVMLRRLRVSGDVASLRSELGNAKPLLEALRNVDTQWPR